MLRFYQMFLSFPLRVLTGATISCKFVPTCSEYAVQAVEKYGAVRGGMKAIGRVVSCQPFVR